MKSFLHLVIVFVTCCLFSLTGCTKATEKQKTGESEKKEIEFNEFLYRKKAILLSIKYRIDEDKVFRLLCDSEDVRTLSEDYEAIRQDRPMLIKNRFISLSEKYDIPLETLANILIDFYSMQAAYNE